MTDENAPAPGFYDDGQGQQRWWDGRAWTKHVQKAPTDPPSGQLPVEVAPKAPARHPLADDPTTIWSAVGRPLTGLGAGRYRLTADLLYFEVGTLSTRAQQIQTWEIHDVDASQTMTQKARGVGTIVLRTRRPGGDEVVTLTDVPDHRDGVRLINETARAAGDRRHQLDRTQHVSYTGGQPAPMPPPSSPASPGDGFMDELARLAEYKKRGLLDDEEFAAAKRKLLGL